MRTHVAKGVSIPKNMDMLAEKIVSKRGTKWSAFVQMLVAREIKSEFKNISMEEIMGTDEASMTEVRAARSITPEKRLAIARAELAKAQRASKKAKAKK